MTTQVLSLPPGHPSTFGGAPSLSSITTASMDQSAPQSSSPHDDVLRGRRRTRDMDHGEDDDDQNDEAEAQVGAGSSKKRRRSRKGLDKKFECPNKGCGKSYSRAEHLYRHQLNHNPKQIYHCDFPDCGRSFVRQDLCARHKERHAARGSQLLRKENFINNLNPIVNAAMQSQRQSLNHNKASPQLHATHAGQHGQTHSPVATAGAAPMRSEHSTPLDLSLHSPSDSTATLVRAQSASSYHSNDAMDTSHPRSATFSAHNPTTPFSQHRYPENYTQGGTPTSQYPRGHVSGQTSQSPGGFVSNQNVSALTQLPPPGFPTMNQSRMGSDEANFAAPAPDLPQPGISGDTFMEGMTPTSYTIPMLANDGYNRSPFAMADDFALWLFDDPQYGPNVSAIGYQAPGGMGAVGGSGNFNVQTQYYTQESMVAGYFPQNIPPQHPMAVSSVIDTNMQQLVISDERRQHILDLIETQFNDTSHTPVIGKEEVLQGNRDDDSHVLSMRMMQQYVTSYWAHFHPQMPILHKPTFSANTCPELLLVAIMCLGASCLEKIHGYEVTQKCAEFAGFLGWHLRWAIFMSADFRPPAKLWVFQTLLLLEIFEKMYSNRLLHEQAHLHHATTLTLMRRGSSLIGRSSVDSPPNGTTNNSRTGSINGTISGASSSTNQFTADEGWNRWITKEATLRAAFAAFVMDSIHATMFGHSAVMVAHEMRLPLPCDEALWSATSSADVGRVEQSLNHNGIKPGHFLDGLKRTFRGESVRTNSFGRTILMAGLLSVSWHMNQRDLQVSSLGVSQILGGRDKWRSSLTRAFDYWKVDLDEAMAKNEPATPVYGYHQPRVDGENVFESRTVLHHLAHMAMHVDIVDCQIFAGASRLLGRGITVQDYTGAQKRMKEGWAPTARARDATFYALRFLSQVLLGDENGQTANLSKEFAYSARDDFLLNRPWVLYFATLIVWSYGYALDGPIRPLYHLNGPAEVIEDMRGFLRRIGSVRAPDDLANVKNRNACLGLLIVMRDTFKQARWELLREGSKLLTKSIEMLSA